MPRALALAGLLIVATMLCAQPAALSVNTTSREEVRQFYRAIYNASENVPMDWTGSYVTGNAGDTTAAFKEAVRLRINFFRALVGVPADITFSGTFNAKAQQAALMMSANNTLQHVGIPPSWTFYTAAGAEGAANSNLYLGDSGARAVTGYMADKDDNNTAVGHRRWLIYPQTLQMGTGDVPGVSNTAPPRAANAVWVVDGQFGKPRPTTRGTAVPYPPAGYVPYTLVWPRWSFSYPDADFSGTNVTMTRNGQSIATAIESSGGATAGEPTLVWAYDNRDTNQDTPHLRPATDTTYVVNVNGVRIGGATQNFTYNVIVFDPDAPGADTLPMTVTGTGTPPIRAASAYTISKPSFASGFDWRTVELGAFAKTFNAENGLDGLIATTTAGYDVVQAVSVASGARSYRLAHLPARSSQILQLPGTFLVSGSNPAISFRSRLGVATAIEVARVQVSTDDGASWLDAFAQAGSSVVSAPAPSETGFTARTISLASYVNRTLQIRLVYTIEEAGTAFLPDATNLVGWFIDDLTVSGVQTATVGAANRAASGNTFSFTPAGAGPIGLQARGVLFGAYPIEWGPVAALTAIDPAVNNNPGRLINMSIRTNAGTGDNTLIVGVGLGGAGTSGSKAVLLRAVGPTLAAFGVNGALADSVMTVFQGSTAIAQNDDWAGAFDFRSVGAFAFTGQPPRDAAIYNDALASNTYSIQVTGKNNSTGVALAEIYDATSATAFTATTPRLVNVSARTQVGTGDNILIAGFVVGGGTPVRVLVRAAGPTLGLAPFGVGGVLVDPKLEIFNAAAVKIAENDNWGGTPELKAAATSVGAFGFASDTSRDAAVIVTLQPGSYTAQVTGVGGTSGVALVEVYELP